MDETDAKKILTAPPLKNWRNPLRRPHTMWMLSVIIRYWNPITSSWMEQLTWLKNCQLWWMMSVFGAMHF